MSSHEYRNLLGQLEKSRKEKARSISHEKDPDLHETDKKKNMSFEKVGIFARLEESKDVSELKQKTLKELQSLGLSDFSFEWVRHKHDLDLQLLTTLPKQLNEQYYSKGYYEDDPILNHVLCTERGTVLFSRMFEYWLEAPFSNDITDTIQSIYDLNADFGFYDFYYIFCKTNSGKVLFSVTNKGSDPLRFENSLASIRTTLLVLCDAIIYVAQNDFSGVLFEPLKESTTVTLNPKPLLVLKTLANSDMNITEVAEKLFMSPVTVNKHLEVVRKAFGVKNTIAAIKLAVLNGLIEFEE